MMPEAGQVEQAREFMGYSRRTSEGVLNAWANSKLRQVEIALVFGISHGHVSSIVYQAKIEGDQRAFARSDAIKARNYAILKYWDGGKLSRADIAEAMGVPETTVCSVLKREKKAGNPLAVRTHENPRAPKPEPVVHIYQKIALLRNKGLTTGQIGALLDRSPKAIRSAERFARNREKRAP